MKVFSTILLLCLAVLSMAQNSPAAAPTSAANVSVGPRNVWATYQDAEFIIDIIDMGIRMTNIDPDGNESDRALCATSVQQTSKGVYLARVDAATWVEVNALNGTTCVCIEGIDRTYHPAWH